MYISKLMDQREQFMNDLEQTLLLAADLHNGVVGTTAKLRKALLQAGLVEGKIPFGIDPSLVMETTSGFFRSAVHGKPADPPSDRVRKEHAAVKSRIKAGVKK